MSERYVIGLDQGTSSTKAVLVNDEGRVIDHAEAPLDLRSPKPGWAEQDPDAMFTNALSCIQDLLNSKRVSSRQVRCLGITNQTESLVVWNKNSGDPVLPALIWQDRRSKTIVDHIQSQSTERLIRSRTGLDLDPTFTAPKLKWVFNHHPDVKQKILDGTNLVGTIDSWLVWKLTGGTHHVTDYSNASRTLLFRIDTLEWDKDLLEIFDIPADILPTPLPSSGNFGRTDKETVGCEIAISGVLGDQQASLFGHGCFEKGEMKVTYGTGAFLWLNIGDERPDLLNHEGCLETIAWYTDEPTYALEGFVMYAGAIFNWLIRNVHFGEDVTDIEQLAENVDDSDGVLLLPAFQGLGSPWWDSSVRASIVEISSSTTDEHIARSGYEAVCFQTKRILRAMKNAIDFPVKELRADGGLTKSELFLQMQANVLDTEIVAAAEPRLTALGVALFAGLEAELWDGISDLKDTVEKGRVIQPDSSRKRQELDERYRKWLSAINASIQWSNENMEH